MKAQLLDKKVDVKSRWHAMEKFFPSLSDDAFWGDHPKYYSTIKPFNFNDNFYLVALDKRGLMTWKFEMRINKWTVVDEFFPIFTNETQWSKPEFYSTIKPYVFNKELYLMAHDEKGLSTWMFDKKTEKWNRNPIDKFFPVFSDISLWSKPEFYSTIKPFVFNNELFLMARDKRGLITWMFDKSVNKWNQKPVDEYFPAFTDDTRWNRPEYYSTIKPFVFNNELFLMARDKRGLITWMFDKASYKWDRDPIDEFFPTFTDDAKWNKPEYYSTIKPVVFNKNLYLIARNSRGLITWMFDKSAKKWSRSPIDEYFPAFTDDTSWNRPEYYSTIQPIVVNNKFFLTARDKKGWTTWKFDLPTQKWNRTPVDEYFPVFTDKTQLDKPEYYSTIYPSVVDNNFFLTARDKKGMITWKFDMPSN